MYRILLLSSATIVLSACSMDGSDSFYGSGLAGQTQHSSAYSQGCQANNCGTTNPYAVKQAPQSYAGYGHAPAHHAASYGATRPDAHAYGSQVRGHHAQGHHGSHGAPQLRGRHNVRHGYKYGTLGAVMYDVDSDIYGVQGRLGYQSAGIFGGEVEGSIGLKGESETVGALTADLDVDYQIGAFAVARAPIGDRFSVFSRLGYAATRLSAELDDGITSVEDSETFDGIAYGVGAEYAMNPRNSLRLDYTRYDLDGLDGETDSIAVSYARKF